MGRQPSHIVRRHPASAALPAFGAFDMIKMIANCMLPGDESREKGYYLAALKKWEWGLASREMRWEVGGGCWLTADEDLLYERP